MGIAIPGTARIAKAMVFISGDASPASAASPSTRRNPAMDQMIAFSSAGFRIFACPVIFG